MSGPNGRIGQEMSAAIQMGALEINASGGIADRKLVVVACDSAVTGEDEGSHIEWLIDDAHVPIVITPVLNADDEVALTRQASDSRWVAIAPVYGPIQSESAQRTEAFWVLEPSFSLQVTQLQALSDGSPIVLVGGRGELHQTRMDALKNDFCGSYTCEGNDIVTLSMNTVTTPSIIDALAQNSVGQLIFVGYADELVELIREAALSESLLDLEILASASAYDTSILGQLETMEEVRLRSQLKGLRFRQLEPPPFDFESRFKDFYRENLVAGPHAASAYDALALAAFVYAAHGGDELSNRLTTNRQIRRFVGGDESLVVGSERFPESVALLQSRPSARFDFVGVSGQLDFADDRFATSELEVWSFDEEAADSMSE